MSLSIRTKKLAVFALRLFLILVSLAQISAADDALGTVNLEWDPNPETNIAGYFVHYGTTSGDYSQSQEVSTSPAATLSGLEPATTYYCVVQAFTTSGLRSPYSSEISFTLPQTNSPEFTVAQVWGSELHNLTASSPSINFGNVDLATPGFTATFILKNPGPEDLTGLVITGDDENFPVTRLGTTSLAPGEISIFHVTFKPSATGSHTTVIRVVSGEAGESSLTINLIGVGVTKPEIAVESPIDSDLTASTSNIHFGDTLLGSTSSTETVTLTNPGTTILTDIALIIDGDHATDFTVSSPVGTALKPGESATFEVALSPSAAGIRTATLHIASSDLDQTPLAIALSGSGIASPQLTLETADGTQLDPTAAAISFGGVTFGTTSEAMTFVVRNTGTTTLTGLQITTGGLHAASFVPELLPVTWLAPGTSTRFSVSFTPTSASYQTAFLQLSSDSTPQDSFKIDGNGIADPEIAIIQDSGAELTSGDSSVSFGNCNLGSSSVHTFTIRNTGSAALKNVSVASDNAEFFIANFATTTIEPGASATFRVGFQPSAVGTRGGQLSVVSNDADESPFLITLTGAGIAVPEIDVRLSNGKDLKDEDTFLNFGTVELGATSKVQILTIRNSGTARLSNLAIAKNGIHATDFSLSGLRTTSLAPGASTSFKIYFSPSKTRIRWAAIHITSNDEDEASFDIVVTGTGIRPPAAALASVQPLAALAQIGNDTRLPTAPVHGIEVIGGRKYLTLTLTKTPGNTALPRAVEVSPDLVAWSSGKAHTTVLLDNATTLKVRDNTPVTRDAKRYIRLKPTVR